MCHFTTTSGSGVNLVVSIILAVLSVISAEVIIAHAVIKVRYCISKHAHGRNCKKSLITR